MFRTDSIPKEAMTLPYDYRPRYAATLGAAAAPVHRWSVLVGDPKQDPML